MIQNQLKADLIKAIEGQGFTVDPRKLDLSASANPDHGHYATNISLQLANQKSGDQQHSPVEIANQIAKSMQDLDYLASIDVAGPGFLNFTINPEFFSTDVNAILVAGADYGQNDLGQNQKIQVEFISANPTGPMTLGNGRGGSIGDTLANVLKFSGYDVNREYYLNDTGNQIRTLGLSVQAAAGKIPAEETHYQGGYIKDLAEKFADKLDQDPQTLGHELANYMIEEELKPAIERLGIHFDEFFSEHSLYPDKINHALEVLKQKNLTYDKDGAVWFKSTDYGDDKDRVLMTSEEGRGRQEPTYFLADIAHYIDVYERGFQKRVNVLGADHHSYATRVNAVIKGLGYQDPDGKAWQDIIIMQLVRLFKDGHEFKMSKRAGNFVTIDELLDEVPADAIRFFFLNVSANSQFDFNLDLAKEQSNKNPVYYVQYAHARTSNILAKSETQIDPEAKIHLKHPAELNLLLALTGLPPAVALSAMDYQVNRLPNYAIQIADKFHKFYEQCQVLQADDEATKQSRLALVKATQITLANTLKLMGISAPERM